MNPRFSLRAGVASALALTFAVGVASPVSADDADLAPTGTITASSTQADSDGTFPATNAIDGNAATRLGEREGAGRGRRVHGDSDVRVGRAVDHLAGRSGVGSGVCGVVRGAGGCECGGAGMAHGVHGDGR